MFIFVLTLLAGGTASAQDKDYFVYFGTYTGFRFVRHSKTQGVGESHSKGIYMSRFNAATGSLSEPELAAEITNPSFITISPDHRFLYAVTEDPLSVGPPLDHVSYVSSYAIDPATGKLRLLNTLPTGGTSTCFISTDKTGKYVLMANFGSGSVSVIRLGETPLSMVPSAYCARTALRSASSLGFSGRIASKISAFLSRTASASNEFGASMVMNVSTWNKMALEHVADHAGVVVVAAAAADRALLPPR